MTRKRRPPTSRLLLVFCCCCASGGGQLLVVPLALLLAVVVVAVVMVVAAAAAAAVMALMLAHTFRPRRELLVSPRVRLRPRGAALLGEFRRITPEIADDVRGALRLVFSLRR